MPTFGGLKVARLQTTQPRFKELKGGKLPIPTLSVFYARRFPRKTPYAQLLRCIKSAKADKAVSSLGGVSSNKGYSSADAAKLLHALSLNGEVSPSAPA